MKLDTQCVHMHAVLPIYVCARVCTQTRFLIFYLCISKY